MPRPRVPILVLLTRPLRGARSKLAGGRALISGVFFRDHQRSRDSRDALGADRFDFFQQVGHGSRHNTVADNRKSLPPRTTPRAARAAL